VISPRRSHLPSRKQVSPRQAGLAIGIGISPGLGGSNEKKARVVALHTSSVVPATGDTPTRPQHQTVRQRTWRQATLASCARIETDKTATTQLQADDATTCRGLPTTHHKVHAPTVSPGPQGDFPCRPASHSESHEVLATGRRAEDGQRHNFHNAKAVGRECAWEKNRRLAGVPVAGGRGVGSRIWGRRIARDTSCSVAEKPRTTSLGCGGCGGINSDSEHKKRAEHGHDGPGHKQSGHCHFMMSVAHHGTTTSLTPP
jgi:hypothetical protein